MIRLELLKTKAELERGLSEFILDCKCARKSTGSKASACRTLATGGIAFQHRMESRCSKVGLRSLRWVPYCLHTASR